MYNAYYPPCSEPLETVREKNREAEKWHNHARAVFIMLTDQPTNGRNESTSHQGTNQGIRGSIKEPTINQVTNQRTNQRFSGPTKELTNQ
jgi:hypothetical protein